MRQVSWRVRGNARQRRREAGATLRVSVTALLAASAVALGGCVSSGDPAAAPPAGSQGTAAASAGPSGAPGQGPTPPADRPVVVGSATDKEACTRVATKLGEWGQAFANAAAGLAAAGSDTGKVQNVVNGVKAANTKFAGDLRAEASKTKDDAVKKVTSDLAAAMDSVNTQLDAAKIAKEPDSLTAAFDQPAYAAAAEAYEKVCAG